MSGAVLFAVVFIGFFILRIIAATFFFFWVLPTGDRCPNCDEHTIRVESRAWNLLMPWFRTSWCYNCEWEGLLRSDPAPAQIESVSIRPGKTVGGQ